MAVAQTVANFGALHVAANNAGAPGQSGLVVVLSTSRILPGTASAPEKQSNKQKSRIRIAVEHAIAGMKRYKILVERFRNKSEQLADAVVEVCAGLWNYKLNFAKPSN